MVNILLSEDKRLSNVLPWRGATAAAVAVWVLTWDGFQICLRSNPGGRKRLPSLDPSLRHTTASTLILQEEREVLWAVHPRRATVSNPKPWEGGLATNKWEQGVSFIAGNTDCHLWSFLNILAWFLNMERPITVINIIRRICWEVNRVKAYWGGVCPPVSTPVCLWRSFDSQVRYYEFDNRWCLFADKLNVIVRISFMPLTTALHLYPPSKELYLSFLLLSLISTWITSGSFRISENFLNIYKQLRGVKYKISLL